MRFATRWGILLVFALLSTRIAPGFGILNNWYSFFWALFIGGLNATIRPIMLAAHSKCGWVLIFIAAAVLNFVLYWITFLGAFSWLGLTVATLGGALLAALIETIASGICNHFIGFKGPGGKINEEDL